MLAWLGFRTGIRGSAVGISYHPRFPVIKYPGITGSVEAVMAKYEPIKDREELMD
jgi:hypothetical protein